MAHRVVAELCLVAILQSSFRDLRVLSGSFPDFIRANSCHSWLPQFDFFPARTAN